MEFTKEQLIEKAKEMVLVALLERQERRKADNAEPVMSKQPYGYVHKGIYESCGTAGLSNDHDAYRNSNMHIALYTAAQPSYSQGIEDAAKWVDQQRKAYDDEHGRTDPDTNTFEFGNDAQREYSDTLAEIAEGIRSLAGQNNE